jgi:hypothetical protein
MCQKPYLPFKRSRFAAIKGRKVMNKKSMCTLLALLAVTSVGISNAPAAPKTAVIPLTQAGQNLETQYAEQLKALRAEIEKSLPKIDEQNIIALQKARDAVKVAEAQAKAAQQELGKVQAAKGLVEHAKGKWIGGAEKGIAQAEASLKQAKTDAEREAAQKELAKWQANKEDGLKALKERQEAFDKIKADEPKLVAANQAAQKALTEARANEMAASKLLLSAVEPLLASDKLDAKLVKAAVLANATPRGLAEFAQQGTEQAALVEKLLSNIPLMKAMLAAGGPEKSKYGPAMQIYTAIQKVSARTKEGQFQRLALATSLEHAEPIAQSNPGDAVNAPAVVDPVKRYLHFEKASLAGELDPAFKDFSAWEYRNVVNGDESDETLTWGREMLRIYRPDHVVNPDYGWRYSRAVATDVRYGSQNVKDDLPSLHKYQNIIKNGGICGRRAFFGRFILRSFGIPTVARPQKGHADAKGVMEMSDADFVMETQVRKQPLAHEKALRAQWIGDALGEAKYISLKPGPIGTWNTVSLFSKRAIAAEAKPVQQAALGENLGEANESAEVRARALVKTTVTDADKKIVFAPNGVITIPAAACTGAQILGSFEGGHQLFSGGGTISCEVELPKAGNYTLTARVSTVQDNPNVLLTVNNAKQPIEIAVPYTIGKWGQTAPATLSLTQGKNSLRFVRPEGSRGLTIKEFTLTPVK